MGREETPGARMSIMSALRSRQAGAGTPRGKTAPTGGASKEGRGCLLISANFRKVRHLSGRLAGFYMSALLMSVGSVQAASGDPVDLILPSGQSVIFHEALQEDQQEGAGHVYRFRFVAHQIAAGPDALSFDDVAQDMQVLCQAFALPNLDRLDATPDRIIVSLSEQPVDFGVMSPDHIQYFEAYIIEDGRCTWEIY
ncbi:hypothetical protein SAMN06295998_104170 [Primorskyibacter flagellatus]|uniref:Acetolactate synthase n=2 Tax=Primorskyibacter flagellatus TaxID=1387277 RepID=A0A1W2BMV8_9RHOB|nr:hypothetical protein SAMN06295998_104170 [Primorskyibacter flagellatus]